MPRYCIVLGAHDVCNQRRALCRVQELLKEHLGRETLEKNINGDEAAVLGAAFRGIARCGGHAALRTIGMR